MTAVAVQLMGIALLARGDDMPGDVPNDEAAIIARIQAADGRVEERNGEHLIYGARSNELIHLAAQLPRMVRIGAPCHAGAPVITGLELRHLKGHKNLREIDITNMPISGEHFEVLTTLPRLEV